MISYVGLIGFAVLQSRADTNQAQKLNHWVDDRNIEVLMPANSPVAGSSFEWNGHRVTFGEKGGLLALDSDRQDWVAIKAQYEQAQAKFTTSTPVWKTRVFLLPRTNILNRGEILRVRKNWIEKDQIDKIYEGLALWAVHAEAALKGSVKVEISVQTDLDEQYQDAASDATPFDAKWAENYSRSRVNGFDFESDDKIYRGPYNSVWILHSGLTSKSARTEIWDTPVTSVPVSVHQSNGTDLSALLFGIWEGDLKYAAKRSGFAVPIEASGSFRAKPSDFEIQLPGPILEASVASRNPSSEEFSSRSNVKGSVEGVAFSSLSAGQIASFGILSSDEMEKILGAKLLVDVNGEVCTFTGEGLAMRMLMPMTSLDPKFEPSIEASAQVTGTKGQVLLVKASYIELFGAHLKSALFHGFIEVNGNFLGVFSVPNQPAGMQECEIFGQAKANPASLNIDSTSGEVSIFSGEASAVKTLGQITVSGSNDSDQGSVSTFDFGKGLRIGRAILFDSKKAGFGIESRLKPKWNFWIKASQVDPILVTFEFENGLTRSVRLFGRWPVPEDIELTPVDGEVQCEADGTWHRISVDLRALGPSIGRGIIQSVRLESDPLAEIWGQTLAPTSSLTLGRITAEPTTEPVPKLAAFSATEPDANSANPESRALWTASATNSSADVAALVKMFKDRSSLVRLNAIAAFQRIKSPESELALVDTLNTLDPRLAQESIEALRFQDSVSAWSAINRTFIGPPLDSHRLFAAAAIGAKGLATSTGTLSTGFATRSWLTRFECAKAIAKIQSKESNLLLIVFIQESVPQIREFVASHADVTNETVCRRLLYSAVNDPHDAVRAACYWRLTGSTVPTFASEGWKGIRDESPMVRLAILDFVLSQPSVAARPSILLAVGDQDPRVRAKALRCLAKLEGEVRIDELGSIPTDTDIRVQRAFQELKAAKGIGNLYQALLSELSSIL